MGKSLRGADASMLTGTADLLIAVHPFGVPSARFAAAATRAGALGVLDLTSGNRAAREELDLAESRLEAGCGVRVAGPAELPLAAHTVLLAAGTPLSTVDVGDRRVLAEVLDTAFALLPEAEPPSDVTMALEVGQDACPPRRFRDTWGTLPAAIRAVHASIAGGLAASGDILPLAQGPVTRVSDQPEFAGAAAAGGALPFLALALSGPAQTREMLEKTKTALGDAPWGVGVLGFAAEEVRAARLEVIREVRPSHAIIEIHAEHGRIDGIVYAAGVIEDRLIADKDPASFNRVFGTKVEGASTLLAATGELPEAPKFAVLFGSVAATLGNRGQSDYAAANDALGALGHRWATVYGRRGLTVHWGPWAPTGANNGVVTPELMRDYARRVIELIDPEEGTLSLLREPAWGDEDLTAVTYTESGW